MATDPNDIRLDPTQRARIAALAEKSGRSPSEIVDEALRSVAIPSDIGTEKNGLSIEQWTANLKSWAASHRQLRQPADDSRASIYSGREE